MKILVFVLGMALVGCAQLLNGQQQPVVPQNIKEKIFFTTCSGSVEEWGSCNQKARSTCAKGYQELKRYESPVGGRREITFQCK